ncbi:MAG: hypothetical protein QM638_16410 [Nocardioides sp.]|uniref:hypothetical protein n=1 Tax=Nocardioides sp. TaxID=35761 RepID=UPI0039E391B7
MSASRRVSWPHLVGALVCASIAVFGGLTIVGGKEKGEAFGFALLGFFGAGAVVLGKQAFRPQR